jgi:hypothetical protein
VRGAGASGKYRFICSSPRGSVSERQTRSVHDLARRGTRGAMHVSVTEVAIIRQLDDAPQVRRSAAFAGSVPPSW